MGKPQNGRGQQWCAVIVDASTRVTGMIAGSGEIWTTLWRVRDGNQMPRGPNNEIQGGSTVRDARGRRAEVARTGERDAGRSCRATVGRHHQQTVRRRRWHLRGIWLGRGGRNRARLADAASLRRLFYVHAGRGRPVRVAQKDLKFPVLLGWGLSFVLEASLRRCDRAPDGRKLVTLLDAATYATTFQEKRRTPLNGKPRSRA